MWLRTGDLCCDTCDEILDYPGPRVLIISIARARGWHCFDGTAQDGRAMTVSLCEKCVGSPRARLPKSAPMAEDSPLFDLPDGGSS